jgi:hypothetical protein
MTTSSSSTIRVIVMLGPPAKGGVLDLSVIGLFSLEADGAEDRPADVFGQERICA